MATGNAAVEFCTACGFPLRGPRCEACGVERAPGWKGGVPSEPEALAGSDARDPTRFIEHCICAEAGMLIQATSFQDGIGWILPLQSMHLFISFDAVSERLSVDVPLARITEKYRVPFLRTALELCEQATPGRLCIRDDLVLLRRVARVAVFTSSSLRESFRQTAATAQQLARTLNLWFGAHSPLTDEQKANPTWNAAGRSRQLKSFSTPPSSGRLMPSRLGSTAPAAPRSEIPPQAARPLEGTRSLPRADADSIPDILSPSLVSPSVSSPLIAATQDMSSAKPTVPDPPSHTEGLADRRNARTVPFRRSNPSFQAVMGPSPGSGRSSSLPEVELEPPSRRAVPSKPETGNVSVDRLCQLLRDSQALATALSFQDRPAVMVLLIRSTVFRAIADFGEMLPHAVAHLYRSTAAATRELAQAESAGRRVNPVAIAEPALLVMERLVAGRGQVPEEKPLHIDPLTTASHAREHVARYLREIERAPADPALRHFLALGALSELLVRAKLPPKTEQRLRDIVAYAQKDGPKNAAIELMMTALTRIVSQ